MRNGALLDKVKIHGCRYILAKNIFFCYCSLQLTTWNFPHTCSNLVHDMGEGGRGRRRETVTWYQPPHDTKTAQYWVLATGDRWRHTPPPAGSDNNSQLSITLTFLQNSQPPTAISVCLPHRCPLNVCFCRLVTWSPKNVTQSNLQRPRKWSS